MPVREVGVESNNAIADCFISLPMHHITGGGKGQGEGRRGLECEELLVQSQQIMEGKIPSSKSPSGCSSLGMGWV